MQGAKFVVHTAAPVLIQAESYTEEDVIKPIIEGTKNMLEACKKNKVGRLVFTSSIATIRH